ncbi:obstructor-J [Musca autumnalis]|uniref:obstructor-J n=1 Tax=Musca autumnalis TaxID=221902 RepID=UPI003CF9F2CE
MEFIKQFIIFTTLLAMSQGLSLPQVRDTITDIVQNVLTICNGRMDDTRFSDYNDCHKFYVCASGVAHEYNCNEGFHFDQNTLSCMDGDACQNKEVPTECTDGSVRAVDGDCFIYQSCVNGQYQNIKCHTGYYFDSYKLTCRPITSSASYKCNCVVPDHTVMSNPDNCQTYYLCEAGQAILTKCDSDQYYNATFNTCFPDTDAICLMKPTQTPMLEEIKDQAEKLAKTAVENLCQNADNNELAFYAAEGDCNKFVVCAKGQLHVQKCPQNFYFDAKLNYCVLDADHKCQEDGKLTEVEDNVVATQEAIPQPKVIVSPKEIVNGFLKY